MSFDYLIQEKDVEWFKSTIIKANECRQRELDKHTKSEEDMASILDSLGVKYERQKIFFPLNAVGKFRPFFLVDFYIKSLNLVIEVDGPRHLEEKCRTRDFVRDAILSALGKRVIRFKTEDIYNGLCQKVLPDIFKELQT